MTIRDRLQATLGSAYTLERELTGGGMSHVFLADETALARRVVVKVFPDELAGSVNVDRFSREIQIAARLQHPCIVPVLGAGVVNGVPFYTMPFVDGESLRTRLTQRGELTVPETLKGLRDLASGLAYAHEHGIVHRDIKPENVLLSDGYAVITDFGVAKALSLSGTGRLTASGVAIGTPGYMSPEQASGDPLTDHRTDIYAFGCVGYEMLVGQPPFAGRSPQAVTAAHLTETPEAVTGLRPSVPVALSRLIARCLEKRPADRPQSARELVQELDAIATPVGSDAKPPNVVAQRVGNRRVRYGVAGGALILVLLSVSFALVARQRAAAIAAAGRARRVVVRTFKNNTGDKTLDPIGLIAADWIGQGLSEAPSVDVAGTESEIAAVDSAGHVTEAMTSAALGQRVHARYVISGSYAVQGDSLFFQAQVTDVDAGRRVLPIEAVGEPLQAKSTALASLRQRVLSALVPFFDASVVTESRVPPRYEAYKEFLLGEQLYDPPHRAEAIPHYRAAVNLDASFVFARLRLISGLETVGALAARDSAIAEVANMRAVLSPREEAAFDIRVGIARRDYLMAHDAAETALRLAPNSTWARFEASEMALIAGRPQEAVRLLESVDPEAGSLRGQESYYSFLCRAYYDLSQLRDLRRCRDRALRQYPGSASGAGYLLGIAGALGEADGVERILDSVPDISKAAGLLPALYELETHGKAERARAIALQVLPRTELRIVGDSERTKQLLNTRLYLLGFLKSWTEVGRLADSVLQRRPSLAAVMMRGIASGMLGDTADARRRADSLIADTPLSAARILAALGDRPAALDALHRVAAPAYWWQYHDDMIYRLMRGYPDFEGFLKPRG